MPVSASIDGSTAAEIADSIRRLSEEGQLGPGAMLPPVRTLATELGVNRNTVAAAYRQLVQTGAVVTSGRGGTRIAPTTRTPSDGADAPVDDVVRPPLLDAASGNPDPTRIPDPTTVLPRVVGRPVLYGEAVIDPGLDAWARRWFADAVREPADVALAVTNGAVDALERLLSQALNRDDAVALEDPCFLASIHTARLGGYRAVPVAVDADGMLPDSLRAALANGVRAIVCTPRAQNPTGSSLSPARAAALQAILAEHPYVLVIEDDHFSMLSSQPYRSIIGPGHRRWAIVRSVSKFLGPDMSLAVVAADDHTVDRLALRLSPGTTWVSHLLQRLTHALVTDPAALSAIADAGTHYASRNAAFALRLAEHGIPAAAGDGLNLWVALPTAAGPVVAAMRDRGWRLRAGDEFRIGDPTTPSRHLRLTVHELGDTDAERLASDLAATVRGIQKD